jgi:Tol biopolymer transport system component/DNA-binding winged helix-turn-helix (wHTH) protein
MAEPRVFAMPSRSDADSVVRFGVFELDLSARELRKQGRKVPLQEQPFRVLELLVRFPNELVAREELRRAVWPSGTFVEFDQSLNTAIKKIRLALGDSAENPRFVETIPRSGYRFIAPLSVLGTPPPPTPRPRRHSLSIGIAVSVTAIICVAVWVIAGGRKQPQPPQIPLPLTSYPGFELGPTFAPDGSALAFTWTGGPCRPLLGPLRPDLRSHPTTHPALRNRFHIYVKVIGSDEPVRLTSSQDDEFSPAWSPDGRFIAFLRMVSAQRAGIFLKPHIGGQERKVGEQYQADPFAPFRGASVSWSPDSKWLVVVDKVPPSSPLALFLLSIETGERRRLTSPPQSFGGDRDPSAIGEDRALVFTRFIDETRSDLFLLRLTDDLQPEGEPTRLAIENPYPRGAVRTPDGSAVIFSSGSRWATMLWKVRTGQPRQPEWVAMAGYGGVGAPAISRQGLLAYYHIFKDIDFWRLELSGGRPAAKPAARHIASTHVEWGPSYSPDGRRIAFYSNRSGSYQLWMCNSDGSKAVQLTSFGADPGAAGFVAHTFPFLAPQWSPDGRVIALTCSTREANSGLYLVDPEGGQPKRVGTGELEGWSSDARWIYFRVEQGGKKQIWKKPVGEGEAVQVTGTGEMGLTGGGRHGGFLYYLKDPGTTIGSLWRVPLNGGKHEQVLESVLWDSFAVAKGGIYFIPTFQPPTLQYLSFTEHKILTIASLEKTPGWGFSISPDERWLLFAQYESVGSDIMLVKNFR